MHPGQSTNPRPAPSSLRRTLLALLLFGVSFGYIEAAIVVYLRALYEPMRLRLVEGAEPGELFPLIRLDQLEAEGRQHVRRLKTELGREAASLALLAGCALAVGRNVRQWFAAFVMVFGVWDIFYYVFLKVLLGWPASLLTWDILFLLPVPWVGPVLAPVIVSVTMIAAGVTVLWRESVGRPMNIRPRDWLLVCSGGLLIVLACCWDYRNTAAGGQPNPFNWLLFVLGEASGVAGFLAALRRRPYGHRSVAPSETE